MTFQNQSIVKYYLKLRDPKEFKVSAILASFYASRSFLHGNVNWLRADLSAVGLMLIALYLLCSPALLPHIVTGAGSLNVQLPSLFIKILRQFAPMTKGHESYSTRGGTESFDEVRAYLLSLQDELKAVIKKQEVNLFGYQVTGLSSKECYFAQLERISRVVDIYCKCPQPEHLVVELLVTLSALRGFQTSDFTFETFNINVSSPIQDVQVGFGIRKYVKVGTKRVSFIGEPSQFHISLFSLFISTSYVELDHDTVIELNSPIIGASIVILNDMNIGDWFLSTLNSRVVSAVHKDPVLQTQPPVVRNRSPLVSRGKSANSFSEGSGKRGMHTIAVRDQTQQCKLFLFDGKNWKDLGYVVDSNHLHPR